MNLYIESIIVIWVMFTVVFVVAQIMKNNSIIDIFWGMSYIFLSLYHLVQNFNPFSFIVFLLVLLWGGRLSYYLIKRNKKEEDARYKKFRETWGGNFVVKAYFKIFMLQAVLMFMISLSLQFMMSTVLVNEIWFYVGVIIWLIGYMFEVISDQQLATFKKNNKGLINVGLWKYSRHPNYFGEIVIWIGFFIISLGFGAPIWIIISPLTIYSVFQFITIPILEKRYDGREDYQLYKKQTNKLIPMRRK